MRKGRLLNSEINYIISKMGHKDSITICDAGLPIPSKVNRIDIALENGTPSFLKTLEVILEELKIEEVVIAKETEEISTDLYTKLLILLEKKCGKINISKVSHEKLKEITKESKSIIRTGECTPYANIILKSGVVF